MTQELQNLDPTSSPHLEEILFRGKVDLDLLSCFPKFGQESSEGLGGIELSKYWQWRRESKGSDLPEKWGRRPFYNGLQNGAVGEEKVGKKMAAGSPAWGRPARRPGRPGNREHDRRNEAGAGRPASSRPWAGPRGRLQGSRKEQTMSRMSPRGGVNRRLKLFLFRGLINAE